MPDVISQRAEAHYTALSQLLEQQHESISVFADKLINALMQEKKVFCCGLGGNAANAQIFAAQLLHRFECERPAFPALALTPDSVLLGSLLADKPHDMFARPLQALAQSGDILLLLASDDHPCLQRVISTAQERGCPVLLLTGEQGVRPETLLEHDLLLVLPAISPALVHELQLFILHCCCDLIDQALFGVHDEENFDH